jgi:hypothetical protein
MLMTRMRVIVTFCLADRTFASAPLFYYATYTACIVLSVQTTTYDRCLRFLSKQCAASSNIGLRYIS